MRDLISRGVLIKSLETAKSDCKQLHEIIFFDAVMAIVDNQPTTFDIDEVIKQIEGTKNKVAQNVRLNTHEYDIEKEVKYAVAPYDFCINIMKGAARGEQYSTNDLDFDNDIPYAE
jgi:hypothetical protein